jgi:hypothetical protein
MMSAYSSELRYRDSDGSTEENPVPIPRRAKGDSAVEGKATTTAVRGSARFERLAGGRHYIGWSPSTAKFRLTDLDADGQPNGRVDRRRTGESVITSGCLASATEGS